MKEITLDLDNPNNETQKKLNAPQKDKKNISKKKKIISLILLIVILGCGVYFTLRVLGVTSKTGLKINPLDLFANEEPQLEKDDDGRTNALIVGIDTRGEYSGLRNTDTIMVASYNHNTKESLLISIPRDTYVQHPYNENYYSKINALYNSCENQEEGTGLKCLADVTETITKLEVQYSAMIDISGLEDVVDILGGIEVNVEKGFIDTGYPNSQNGTMTISFEAGPQKMDGERAVQYARSRHSSSDFDRAERQQIIIKAILKKIMSSETYTNPAKVLDIMDQVEENITLVNIDTTDIKAALSLKDDINLDHIYGVVLDPTVGNWSLIVDNEPSIGTRLIPVLGYNDWSDVNKFVEIFLKYPGMYSEKPIIYLYNGGLGYEETSQQADFLKEEYPFINIVFGGNMATLDYTGNTIASFSEDTKTKTIEQLEKFFNTDYSEEKTANLSSRYGEDIAVILGAPAENTTPPE